jgi:hypothetical protein
LLLLDDGGGCYVFIYPAKEKNEKIRTLSTDFSTYQQTTAAFNLKSRMECKIIECFKMGKVCYSDNLTAADFSQVQQQYKFI